MKKILIICMSILLFTTACQKKAVTKTENSDALKFKEEYESLNNKTNDNGKTYPKLEIAKNNPMTYKSIEEIIDIINNKTGIIYLGYPECPWCRNAVPVLLEAAKQTGIKNIYYLNMYDIRDKKSLDEDGNVVTEEEGNSKYQDLIEALGDYADTYDGLNDESIKRIYVPIVIFVKDGEIVGVHKDTVESQEDPYVTLDEEQQTELLKIYKENIHKVLDDLCDTSC